MRQSGLPGDFSLSASGKAVPSARQRRHPCSFPVREVTRPSWRVEFFWLCDECAAELTLGYNQETGITVVPRVKELASAQTV
jgi:hypothetical protein